VEEGGQRYCLSALVDCQAPPAKAARYRDGLFVGLAMDRLVAHPTAGADAFPLDNGAVSFPVASPASGALRVDKAWRVAWQFTGAAEAGTLSPHVLLSRDDLTAGPSVEGAGALPAATPSGASSGAPTAALPRYRCTREGGMRNIWVIPGDAAGGYVCRAMFQVGDTPPVVLWNARQHPEMCAERARARVAQEQAQGYRCASAAE
jgi:hypothetical protein